MSTSWEVDNETMTGVNSRFAVVTEKKYSKCAIVQFLTIERNLRNYDWKFSIQFADMSSTLTAFLNPDRQAPLMSLSLNKNCPIQVSSTSIEQKVSIQENLNVVISKNGCDFKQQAHEAEVDILH